MAGSAAVAAHARAGRVEPTRLAVRTAEATGAPGPDEGLPVAAELPLAPGEQRLGPWGVGVELNSSGSKAWLDLRVLNLSDRSQQLESLVLGFRWLAPDAGSLRFLRHGWQSWSYTGARELDGLGEPPFPSGAWLRGMHHAVGARPLDREGWHESELVTVVGASPGGAACLVGAQERGRSFGVLYLRPEGDAVAIEAELVVDATLRPGEALDLDRLRVALDDDASRLLESYAESHGRLAGARAARPFLTGWCSWYHFFQRVDESAVLRNLEALAADRSGLPVDVVQIDDGYQRAVGDWLETNESFPRGLAPLAEEIRSAGFTPGLWLAPFCAVPESELLRKHPEWLLRRAGEPFRALLHPEWTPQLSVFALDASHPEAIRHLEETARALVGLGFRYLKLDFLYAGAMRAEGHDPGLPRAARLRRGLEALRSGAGEETFLLGCGCPLGAAVGVVDGMRVGPDVAPTWHPQPEVSVPGLEETQPSVRSAIRNTLARVWMHRRLWLNDPDCLMVRSRDSQLSEAERRSLGAAIGATGGLAIVSDDLPTLSSAERWQLREAFALAAEVDAAGLPGSARARDLLAGEIVEATRAPLSDGAVVAAWNPSGQPRPAGLEAEPREARREPRLGSARGPEPLAPHDAVVYRVRDRAPLAVFCDFDGTFSVQDVGATLAQRHAGERRPALWARYERGEISAWEYNMEVLHGLALPPETLDAFLREVELDPGARDLVAWCEAHGVPFRVLSDGFDWNLLRLQQLHRLRFAFEANHLDYDGGRWRLRPGRSDPSCRCGTGTCKRAHIESFRERNAHVTIVHVGNGYVSDLCGALAADVAFAKDSLASELERRGEPFEPFATLHDVIAGLEGLWADTGPEVGED